MDTFIKNIGVIVVLVGVAFLAIPQLLGFPANSYLLTGCILMLAGILLTIFLGRYVDGKQSK